MKKAQSRLKSIKRKTFRRKAIFSVFTALSVVYLFHNINLNPVKGATAPTFDVREVEVVKEVEVPVKGATDKQQYMLWAIEIFGDEANNAIKIMECESGFKADRIGDTHIMGELNGEMIGDSVGLFQIRTGDAGVYESKPWNRAKANGMSAEEFRVWMSDPYENIKYAKTMYDRKGWEQWFNCMNKMGVK